MLSGVPLHLCPRNMESDNSNNLSPCTQLNAPRKSFINLVRSQIVSVSL